MSDLPRVTSPAHSASMFLCSFAPAGMSAHGHVGSMRLTLTLGSSLPLDARLYLSTTQARAIAALLLACSDYVDAAQVAEVTS